jgi:hypothetical protein
MRIGVTEPPSRHASRVVIAGGVVALACAAGFLGSTLSAKGQPNLVPNGSFESSLSGWRGQHARLSRTRGGVVGRMAARVSVSGSWKSYSIRLRVAPVSSTRAGAVYRAGAWVRGAVAVRPICLRIREWRRSGPLVGARKTCIRSTRRWAVFRPARYTARATGNRLDTYVYQRGAVAGDRFDLDGVRLTGCGWGTFSSELHVWPSACWRPFAATSPFNKPIPADPKIRGNSAAIVARLLSTGGGPGNLVAGGARADNYGHPVVYSRPNDPVYTIHCTRYACDDLEGKRVRIPVGARPVGGSDRHLAVVDQTSGYSYDFWEAGTPSGSGGTLSVGSGGVARVDGHGTGRALDLDGDGRLGEATAARFALLAGIVRAEELAARRIDHALFITVPCGARQPSHVAPATKSGTLCADNTNRIPMGARLRLNMTSAGIEALDVARWKKTILHALRVHGAYMSDTGGPSSFGVMLESDATYTAFGVTSRMVEFAAANDWTRYDGAFVGNLRDGVPWSRLQVLDWSDPANH